MASENTQKKYSDIRKEYIQWTDRKYKGVRKFTNDFIFVKLGEKYYLKPTTIEDIIYYRVKIRS